MSTKPDLQILPGSVPGKIRIVGAKADADVWVPQILADREKIKAVIREGDELVRLILLAAAFYECPAEEVSTMLSLAARDPENALMSYSATVQKLGIGK